MSFIFLAALTYIVPAFVSCRGLYCLSKSSTPSRFSSFFTIALKAGWLINKFSAFLFTHFLANFVEKFKSQLSRDKNNRGEDKTINELEDLVAATTGKEAALLCPTGTFANTVGALLWAKAGEKVLVQEQQHMLLTEKFLFSDQFCRMEPIKYPFNANNTPDIDAIDNLLQESGAKLICIENTHNFSGGL